MIGFEINITGEDQSHSVEGRMPARQKSRELQLEQAWFPSIRGAQTCRHKWGAVRLEFAGVDCEPVLYRRIHDPMTRTGAGETSIAPVWLFIQMKEAMR